MKTTLPDSCFLLFDVLQAAEHWQRLPAHAETDSELARQILEEAAAFIEDRIAPLQRVGDQVGCRFNSATGAVTTPPGFVETYRDFQEAGWTTLARPLEEGGQGLPSVIESVLDDMLSQANQAWNMAPGLLHGACECLRHAGSDALRAQWLPQLVSGQA